MNKLHQKLIDGTLGELLVQAQLLQHDVQAAPPLRDTGNDLIAVRESAMRAIQVKTTQADHYILPKKTKKYDILAAVKLVGHKNKVTFDQCKIFLIGKNELAGLPRKFSKIDAYELSQERIDALFPKA
jgi:hypothetical protein